MVRQHGSHLLYIYKRKAIEIYRRLNSYILSIFYILDYYIILMILLPMIACLLCVKLYIRTKIYFSWIWITACKCLGFTMLADVLLKPTLYIHSYSFTIFSHFLLMETRWFHIDMVKNVVSQITVQLPNIFVCKRHLPCSDGWSRY